MKKNLLPILLFATTLTACGGNGLNTNGGTNTTADLKITFFNGGYGTDWINNLAKRFEQATGKTVEVVKSEEGNCGADTFIRSGYNLSDIYIGEGVSWKSLLQDGYLEDLTDVYEATVETKAGPQKVKDFMDQGIVGNFYAQRKLNDPTLKPWAMPWTAKPNGMAYNEDILKEIKHVSSTTVSASCIDATTSKWITPPETYDDLLAFCDDVIAFNNNSAEKQALNDSHDYVPVGWCGSINADSVGFLVISWWAEMQGLEASKISGEGSFYDFYNFGNRTNSHIGQTFDLNVYRQTGLKDAFNKLANLLVDSSTGQFKNSLNNAYNMKLQEMQQLFVSSRVNQKPVLSIASSYLENEVVKNKYIDSDEDGVQDVNFKFMNVPTVHPETEDLLYLNFSDSMIVPTKASHKDVAKQFLIFMSSEQECINFAKETNGGIRPFNCDVRTEATGNEYTTFTNSLFDVYYNSKHFYEYPRNAESLAGVSHIFRYANAMYIGTLDWLTVIDLLKSPGTKEPGVAVMDEVVGAITRSELDTWIKKFKLTDVSGK